MARIYVDYSGFEQLGPNCKTVSSKITTIHSELQGTINSLDWEVSYQTNIQSTTKQLVNKMRGYSSALDDYRNFLDDALKEYRQLDQYDKKSSSKLAGSSTSLVNAFLDEFSIKDLIGNFGNFGKLLSTIAGAYASHDTTSKLKAINGVIKTMDKISKDWKNYTKISNAIGPKSAAYNYLKKEFGFTVFGHVSVAKKPTTRFFNNLTNKTSQTHQAK